VERADPHPTGGRAEQTRYALLHLACSLVGERDGQHLVGPHPPGLDKIRQPMRKHTGLAGPSTGEDQQGTPGVKDGFALRFVEALGQVEAR
jgi:hypothetical protein